MSEKPAAGGTFDKLSAAARLTSPKSASSALKGGGRTVRVKICGLTRREDARAAVRSGADAVGLIFAASKRRVTPEAAEAVAGAAREEAAGLGRALDVFGVFVNEAPGRILELARGVPLDVIQLHGDEEPDFARDFAGIRLVKAVRVRGRESLGEVRRFAASGAFEAVLLDAYCGSGGPEAPRGGTGRTFDWEIAADAAREHTVILSGGLRADNVAEAVRRVRPAMVDASSGVERAPGEKDHDLIERFVREAKSVG